MQLPQLVPIGGFISLAFVVVLVLARKRLGELNAASWLVIWGGFVLLTEHPQFAISYSVPLPAIADELLTSPVLMVLLPHARIHFFMAGIYAVIGLVLLAVIARTLLREGRRSGWFAVLFALLIGGSFDLIIGTRWYPHGSPLAPLIGKSPVGFGWQFLYVYFIAWTSALVLSYRQVFGRASG